MTYLSEMWRVRYFWLAMVRNDLRSRYRRSVIGIGWSMLHPIAMTLVLCVVFGQLFKTEVASYAPFVLCGLTFWSFVTSVLHGGAHCFFANESYIRQHPAPLAIYPLRSVLGAGFHFLLGLMIALVVVWLVRGPGNLAALVSLPLTLVLVFLFGWSLAVCMGTANVFFQDTQHLLEVALQIIFYMTPVMYEASLLEQRGLGWLVSINPLALFLQMIRQPILEGRFPPAHTSLAAVLTTALAVGLASWILRRVEKRLIFYL